ncbi:unnamed protein product [Adineta ricciae]|uniref:G-protein coupled receptors family 1 profile domain-containing protein n=1 Tax=Adineta ricciae TaxID=249248 RepID=A0A814NBL8_ADIRI|nr:unnamed protein product [Adineta ricciae]CAF1493484.1 unnamed protein product [Adineta ricciae]
MHLSYYYLGVIWPSSLSYCSLYQFLDYYFYTTCFLLLTWASVERHILIFHCKFFKTPRQRLVGHYFPLMFCIIYPLIYYIVFVYLYPCENSYDIHTSYCVVFCYLLDSSLMNLYEQIVHGFALIFLILIFNISLILRVIRQKRQMGRQMTWNQNRKLAMQLFGMFALFLATNGIYFTIQLGKVLYDPNFGSNINQQIVVLSLSMPPLVPIVCLITSQELRTKLNFRFNRNVVKPIAILELKQMRGIRT